MKKKRFLEILIVCVALGAISTFLLHLPFYTVYANPSGIIGPGGNANTDLTFFGINTWIVLKEASLPTVGFSIMNSVVALCLLVLNSLFYLVIAYVLHRIHQL